LTRTHQDAPPLIDVVFHMEHSAIVMPVLGILETGAKRLSGGESADILCIPRIDERQRRFVPAKMYLAVGPTRHGEPLRRGGALRRLLSRKLA
jgi:hypothetical protein